MADNEYNKIPETDEESAEWVEGLDDDTYAFVAAVDDHLQVFSGHYCLDVRDCHLTGLTFDKASGLKTWRTLRNKCFGEIVPVTRRLQCQLVISIDPKVVKSRGRQSLEAAQRLRRAARPNR